MLGRPDSTASLGAVPCAITWLFRGISEQRHKCGTRFSVRVSAVELCTNTNQIRDLLAPYQNGKNLLKIVGFYYLLKRKYCVVVHSTVVPYFQQQRHTKPKHIRANICSPYVICLLLPCTYIFFIN